MNIFERIQHDTGLENYCTDILVGILQKNPILLEDFCVIVLKISKESIPRDNSLKIEPQIYYKEIDDINKERSYVDIEISGTDFLCFLEMKVESNENKGQLSKYHDVLVKEQKAYLFLRFCTKYKEEIKAEDNRKFEEYDNKRNIYNESQKYFQTTRWYHIYKFLSAFRKDNTLINEFLEFLTLNNMDNKSIVYKKETALSFYENFIAFDQILRNVKKEDFHILKNHFSSKINPELNFEFKRYGLFLKCKDEIEHKALWTAIFVGFQFKVDGIYKLIWLWSKDIDKSELNKYKFNESNINRHLINGLKIEEKIEENGTLVSDTEKWFIEELKNIQLK